MAVVTSMPSMTLTEAFEAFPNVAKPVIIRADLMRLGINYTQAARQQFAVRDDIAYKGFSLFSYAMGKAAVVQDREPADCSFEDGTPAGTGFGLRTGGDTPYAIDYIDGEFWVLWRGQKLAKVHFGPPDNWWNSLKLPDGTPFRAIATANTRPDAVGVESENVFVTLNKNCEYFNIKKECLYCDLTTHAATQKKGGEAMVLRKNIDQVCDVLEVAFSRPGVDILFLTGGVLLGNYQGKDEIDWYLDMLNAIHERLVQWPFTTFQVGAPVEEDLKRIHDTGVPDVQMNMEVWNKRLFEIICPGKAERVGQDEWKRRMLKAVDIWGPRGHVTNSFVTGVEMCQPYGWTNVDDAVNSIAEGYEWMLSNGIDTRYGGMWCVESQSKLAGNQNPPLEFYIKAAERYLELHEKYFPHPRPFVYGQRRGYGPGLDGDVLFWHGSSPGSRQFMEKTGVKITPPDYTKYL